MVVQPRLGPLSVSKATSNSVTLSWSVPVGRFDSFLIQYKDAEGKPQVLPLDGDSRDVTVPGLVPSRRYKFNLYGIYGSKRLGPISTDAVTGQRESFFTMLVAPGSCIPSPANLFGFLGKWCYKKGNFTPARSLLLTQSGISV